jgi:hypothetical protein
MRGELNGIAARSVRQAEQADWRAVLARSGLASKGILYAALGLLAINVASGKAGSQTASRQGAIELVASQPFGQWLLGILTVGLFALAAWHIIQAIKGDPVEGSDASDRARFAGKAVIYIGTAMTALTMLMPRLGSGSAGAGSGGTEDQATATVMSWPGGPWIVGIAGAAIIAFAIYQFYKHAWHTTFMQRLDRGAMHGDVSRAVERAGQVGYAARAIVAVVAGAFLVVAAVQHDPREAVGLSGALGALSGETWGQVVLWIVAIGLVLYGAFAFAEAKYRRAT